MRTTTTVGDLRNHPKAGTMLYCWKCGAENSAHAGDYFMASDDHVFKCCDVNMLLVKKNTTYREVA